MRLIEIKVYRDVRYLRWSNDEDKRCPMDVLLNFDHLIEITDEESQYDWDTKSKRYWCKIRLLGDVVYYVEKNKKQLVDYINVGSSPLYKAMNGP